jgi:uncharacterized protein (DUF1501 family)
MGRREFLAIGSAAVLGARVAVRPSGQPAVVAVFLRGGVDGLSLVVPHGDPLLYQKRPRLAIPARGIIDLDGYFGLHPALAPLRHWWDTGSLAIAPAAGFPSRVRSHVDGQQRVEQWLDRIGAERWDSWGWDTHLDQRSGGAFDARLRRLAVDLDAFARDRSSRMRDTVIITVSEFGRTVGENAFGGTDHGHATVLLAFGGPVRGRAIVGTWPGLARHDVAVTADTRDLFGAMVPLHTGA